ncbi:hypothetical protein U9M48_035939 [Paspalum notatum var. saurae]|uniref:Uncharacterized protein n=1 Tax=Paspalum notatum var. saurae TaxID=547442 RepID=A0AAQ3UG61_PASNO
MEMRSQKIGAIRTAVRANGKPTRGVGGRQAALRSLGSRASGGKAGGRTGAVESRHGSGKRTEGAGRAALLRAREMANTGERPGGTRTGGTNIEADWRGRRKGEVLTGGFRKT